MALSRWCYPECVAESLINFYLYIANDPGEGTQAKRRISTVIIDHDLPFINEYAKISDRNSEGFECYVGLTNKYVCSLLELQFKCRLHVCCVFSLDEIIDSTLLLMKWQVRSKLTALSANVDKWQDAKFD